jgi:hypothetical protein
MATQKKTDSPTVKPLASADLLKSDHPLHNSFTTWLDGKEATKRQASKFLRENPHYRTVKEG